MDERVATAAAGVGLQFRQDLMLRTPNTLDAHRLIWLAGKEGVQDAVMEAVFAAYFIAGRATSATRACWQTAPPGGMDRASVVDFLAGDVAAKEMLAADRAAREAGVNGVPAFFLDGYSLFSGAMPAEHHGGGVAQGPADPAPAGGVDRRIHPRPRSAIVGRIQTGNTPCPTR